MIEQLKKLGFNVETHPSPNRDFLIKVQLGEVVITKTKGYYHVMVDVLGGTWTKNCKTQDEVLSYLDSEFIKEGAGRRSTFGKAFPF